MKVLVVILVGVGTAPRSSYDQPALLLSLARIFFSPALSFKFPLAFILFLLALNFKLLLTLVLQLLPLRGKVSHRLILAQLENPVPITPPSLPDSALEMPREDNRLREIFHRQVIQVLVSPVRPVIRS